jgi:hypothetical protein
VIINAVVLLTGIFDDNIVYRHDSTESKGKDPNVLDSNWALVHITIPAVLGKNILQILYQCSGRVNILHILYQRSRLMRPLWAKAITNYTSFTKYAIASHSTLDQSG